MTHGKIIVRHHVLARGRHQGTKKHTLGWWLSPVTSASQQPAPDTSTPTVREAGTGRERISHPQKVIKLSVLYASTTASHECTLVTSASSVEILPSCSTTLCLHSSTPSPLSPSSFPRPRFAPRSCFSSLSSWFLIRFSSLSRFSLVPCMANSTERSFSMLSEYISAALLWERREEGWREGLSTKIWNPICMSFHMDFGSSPSCLPTLELKKAFLHRKLFQFWRW